jgi:hypothetical protein
LKRFFCDLRRHKESVSFMTRRFGDWILSLSSVEHNQFGQIDMASLSPDWNLSTFQLKTETDFSLRTVMC